MGYVIRNIPCNSGNYTRQQNSHEWIMIHYTATTASAANNGAYFANNSNCGASAHFFVDGSGTIIHSVPIDYVAWHAGNWNANCSGIGIEVVSAGADFTNTEIAELTWLVQLLMEQFNIPASHVIRHYDVADHFSGSIVDPHKRCPAPYIDNAKWKKLHEIITQGDDDMSSYAETAAAELTRTDDPTGNHTNGNMFTRVAYIDGRLQDMQPTINKMCEILTDTDVSAAENETGEHVNTGANMPLRLAYMEAMLKKIMRKLDIEE